MKKSINTLTLIFLSLFHNPIIAELSFWDKIESYFQVNNIWHNPYFRSIAFTGCLEIDNIPLATAIMNNTLSWQQENIDKLTSFLLINTPIKANANLNELLDAPQTYISNQNAVFLSFIIINSQKAEAIIENTPLDELEAKMIGEADKIQSLQPSFNQILNSAKALLMKDPKKILINLQNQKIVSISQENIQKAIASINVQVPIPTNEQFSQTIVDMGFDAFTQKMANYLFSNAQDDGKTFLTIAISTLDTKPLVELCNRCALHSSVENIDISYVTIQLAFNYPNIYNFAYQYYENEFFEDSQSQ
jgi:hypothetical protein